MADSTKNRPLLWIVAGLAGVAVLVAAAWLAGLFSRASSDPVVEGLTADEARALIQTKNVGLGELENQQLDPGLTAFEQIATKLPADPLGPRNVAVARVLALGVEDEAAPPELVAAAQAALAKMAELEGETTTYHWLALSTAVAAQDYAAAEVHLDAITKAEPDDPAGWYAHFRASRASGQQVDPAAIADLTRAYELRPSNSWLLVEWLRASGSQLNDELDSLPNADPERAAALTDYATRHARLAQQLAAARPTAQAFAHVVQAHGRVDVLAFLDEAAAAAEKGDWQAAATRMLVMANVLLPHAVLDRQAVRRHPLEFVLDRFAPEFYAANQVGEFEQQPQIDVTFAAPAAWQVPAALAEGLGTVQDLALADFDLDGRLDLLVLTGEKLVVLGRQADAGPWQEIASAPSAGATGLVVQDLDADFDETAQAVRGTDDAPADPADLRNICPTADVDVALFGPQGVSLIENRFDAASKQRTLVAVAAEKLPAKQQPVRTLACADLEADGDLDLVLATDRGLALWRNNSNWSFADISQRSVLPEGLSDAAQFLAFDLDRDVDIDVLVASPSGGGWLENLRHGQFRWRASDEGFPGEAAALVPVDPDGDASWDLLATGQTGFRLVALQNPSPGVVRSAGAAEISTFSATNLATWDYDNDGWEDCLAWSANKVQLFRGLAEGKFDPAELLAAAPQQISTAQVGDLDADGDQDLAVVSAGRIHLLENQGGNQNHWLDVALQGQQVKGQQLSPSGRVSPYGVGSLLELKAGQRYQARIVRGQATHFGLGRSTQADVVRVGWLNGVPQNIIQPAADLFVCEQQILMGSCPYLYAWNGERFEFVTDLLWNAPIGLQLAEGQLAPWRDWEYLKVGGEQLAPREGHYELQVTAELWEADYFDQVKLIAVDHPADVEIYSNEKVGPPALAAYKIHTVSEPRTPRSARNHAGRDLLPEIASQDGVYAQTYERKWRQGVVEDHFIELDLGDLSQAQRVTLLLTGWMYPAATSTNVGLSQGGSLAPATPPSLEVPDGQGGWKTAIPFMGFPGGKTKTIAMELPGEWFQVPSSKFKVEEPTLNLEPGTSNSARIRIRTSMEIYWDQIFFTVDESPAEVRTTELALVSADLHARGFSRVVRDAGNGPERFLYADASPLAKWPPMLGRFTRYGDVLGLLSERDDRLLVMAAGDEATLRFAVPSEPLPAGWKRDFLMYNVGWDKDANLETVLGQSCEPLPFEKMSGYPWPPDEPTADSPAYRDYLRTYQTRRQSAAYWKAVQRFEAAPFAE